MCDILLFIFYYFFIGFILSIVYIYLVNEYCKISNYPEENFPSFVVILLLYPIFSIVFPIIILLIIEYKIKES